MTAFLGLNNSLKRNYSISNSSNLSFKYKKKYNDLHLTKTQLKILQENKFKSGIYLIKNKINGKFYIGSAITNRISVRFRNHCIHGTGSSILNKAIKKYGLENFTFYILEYYPGFIHKENFKKGHLDLLAIETKYINLFNPSYNILTQSNSSLDYKHNQETLDKMKNNYKNLSIETKTILSKKMKIRYLETNYKEFLSKIFSKPLILFNKDGTIHSEYNSITECSKHFKCCTKTINKSLKNNTLFLNKGYLKYKTD